MIANSMIIILVSVCLLTIGELGCTAKIDIEHEKAELIKADTEFSNLSEEKDVSEAFYQYMAEDAMLLTFTPPIMGREAIRDAMPKKESGYVLTWEPQHADVSAAGDLGYTWGTYEAVRQGPDGKDLVSMGKYLTVWRKQADGAWKAIADIGTPDQ